MSISSRAVAEEEEEEAQYIYIYREREIDRPTTTGRVGFVGGTTSAFFFCVPMPSRTDS